MSELHEEYVLRHKDRVKVPLIKYVERANLILKSKEKNSEWAWLHVNIASVGDGNHPQKFSFVVSANPAVYTTNDFQHFSNNSKVINEYAWEWDQYEQGVLDWARSHTDKYEAIGAGDAIFVAWEMFVTNYDSWIAHFLPFRMQENIFWSLNDKNDNKDRLNSVQEVEDYVKHRYDRVFSCWKTIRGALEQKNYADWLAKVINGMTT